MRGVSDAYPAKNRNLTNIVQAADQADNPLIKPRTMSSFSISLLAYAYLVKKRVHLNKTVLSQGRYS